MKLPVIGDFDTTPLIKLLICIASAHLLGYLAQACITNRVLREDLAAEIDSALTEYKSALPAGSEMDSVTALSSVPEVCKKLGLSSQPRTVVVWLTLSQSKETRCTAATLIRNHYPAPGSWIYGYFLGGIEIVSSPDLVARHVEVLFQAESERPKLCAGTRAQPEHKICTASKRFVEKVSILDSRLSGARWFGLVLGPIQYWSLGLAVFCMLQSISERRKYGAEQRAAGLAFLQGSPTSGVNHVQARMFEALRAGLSRVSPASVASDLSALSSNLLDRATFEKQREEDEVVLSRTIVDTIGNLAFIGTILGIILSMFQLSIAQSADPLRSAIARNALYNSMGLAFGTTLLGLGLNTLLTARLDSVSRSHKLFVNAIYDDIVERIAAWTPGSAPYPVPPIDESSAVLQWLAVPVVGLVAAIIWSIV